MGDRLFAGIHRSRLELVGLAVFAAGALLDLTYHAAPAPWQGELGRYLGANGFNAHLVTFVGMVLIALALLDAARGARIRWREQKEVSIESSDPHRFVHHSRADRSRRR